MRKIWIVVFVVFSSSAIFAQDVFVTINGIENNTGVIQIGLYNSSDSFAKYELLYMGVAPKADKEGVSHTFKDLPSGTYAIAVWHDENEDKSMNKNLFGAPSERYGFSNNVFGSFGPPKFEKASFIVKSGKKTAVEITLD